MKSRFKRKLHEYFLKENISLESGIVNELTYQIISLAYGIKIDNSDEAPQSNYGFTLDSRNYYSYGDDKELIKFKLPKIPMSHLLNHLEFFNIPQEDYETNSSLTLDEKYVFEDFLPCLTNYYEYLKVRDPNAINKFKIKSMPILESSAISTLEKKTQEVIKTIITDQDLDESNETKVMIDSILLLEAKVNKLDEIPIFYKDIIATALQIEKFRNSTACDNNVPLKKQLKLVAEGIDMFSHYHRYESVIANKKFMNEVELFLQEHQISHTQCHIIEETLVRISKIELGEKKDYKFDIGYDASRLVFTLTDIDDENAEKFVNFFRQLGDATANLGFGHKKHGSEIPELFEKQSAELPQRCKVNRSHVKKVKSHSIEVDGKFFYEYIFPALKNEICEMEITDKTILDKYREESKEYLTEKLANQKLEKTDLNVSKNKSSLFQGQTTQTTTTQTTTLLKEPANTKENIFRKTI